MNSILNRWKTALVVLVAGLTGWVGAVQGGTPAPSAYVVLQNDAFSESSRAIQVLCAQFLRDEGFQVQDPDELQIVAPEKSAISELAKMEGVEQVLYIEALPLDTAFLVSFTLASATDQSILGSRQVTMASMEEVRPVLQRGIRSLIRGETVEESAELSTITREESARHRKRKGKIRGALGLSGGTVANAAPESYYGALGRVMFEAEEFRLQGGLTLLGSRDLGFAALGLGGAYLFPPKKIHLPTSASMWVGEDTPARMRKRTTTSRRKTPRSSKAADFR